MMVYCHFQAKPIEQVNFSFPWKSRLSEKLPLLNILEADNRSDTFLVQEIAKLVSGSEKVACFFEVTEGEHLGSLAKVLETLRKSQADQLIIIKGQSQQVEKVLQMLKKPILRYNSEAVLLKKLEAFFKA